MIQFQEALNILRSIIYQPKTEKISLLKANHRVLAQDIFMDMFMPPFDKSAMDGFACKKVDLGQDMVLMETIYAGSTPTQSISAGQCSKIMTGAMVPEGADCVFMKEDSLVLEDGKIRCTNPKSNTNICYLGEDIKTGDKVMDANTLITARHIPTIAGAGIYEPLVYSQPRISVLATGSELVEPAIKPGTSQIRNTNSSQMLAQIQELGMEANYGGIVPDTPEDTARMIKDAMEISDVIILTGGVSVGEYDFTQDILAELGFDILITTVATQPGKPLIFAKKGNQFAFGLAGNPVSSFVQFDFYVKPFIYQLMNYSYERVTKTAVLNGKLKRRRADRLKLIPAFWNEKNQVKLIEFHGSAHINALSLANCLIEFPLDVFEINEGEDVRIHVL